MNETLETTTEPALTITRLIDAPRELVYKAFTDPEHIAEWWGPNGFTNTIHSMDVRPGGMWRFTMHGPDGTDWPNRIIYTNIIENELLEFDHDSDKDNDPHAFRSSVSFADRDGKTEVTLHTVFSSQEELDRVKKFGAEEGGRQNLARLAAYLGSRE